MLKPFHPATLIAISYLILASTPAQLHAQSVKNPELIKLPAGTFAYRASGEFLKNDFPTDAPRISIRFSRALHIMKYQVSNREYARCVDEHKCALPFKKKKAISNNFPATGLSFIDAENYARWLTQKTGVRWRLPSDAEWAYSAGERFFDDALGQNTNPADPSKRILLKYQQSVGRDSETNLNIRVRGSFGANSNGLYDQSGNVWEWTNSCYQRSKISDEGKIDSADNDNCGVRIVEGRHRSYMTYFVQDAKSGGCAVGAPPDYLGFRLVRDNPKFLSVRRMQNWWLSLSAEN